MGCFKVIPLPGESPIPTRLTAHGHFWWNMQSVPSPSVLRQNIMCNGSTKTVPNRVLLLLVCHALPKRDELQTHHCQRHQTSG